jgi:hypothetical protein
MLHCSLWIENNPTYSGDSDQKDPDSELARGKSSLDLISKTPNTEKGHGVRK